MTVTFDYYLIGFELKYFKGDIFTNGIASSASDIIAYVSGGLIYKYLGLRVSLPFFFLISTIGGLLINFIGNDPSLEAWVFPLLVLIAKFGIAALFNIVYVANSVIFPTLFAATAMGICNFLARVATIFAPLVAETESNTAMELFTAFAGISFVLSFFVK
jgi:OCT family organic cation transporter-like MFS transporter 4/5